MSDNQVVEGIHYSYPSWMLSNGTRTDAAFELALAYLYQYQITADRWYRDKAFGLLERGKEDALLSGRYPAIPTSVSGNVSVFTQDNGKAMVSLAKCVELTNDTEMKFFLSDMANYWDNEVYADGSVGVGIDCVTGGNHLDPPDGVCARATTSLLIGFDRAYEVVGNASLKSVAVRLGNWLADDMNSSDHLPCPADGLGNGGVGNEVETNGLGLRAMTLLYKITRDYQWRLLADKIYSWLKTQIDNTCVRWSVSVPSDFNRDSSYRYFNTLYMFVPSGLIDYSEVFGLSEPLDYAKGILSFMAENMTMHGSPLIEGGIVGEWDLMLNKRSEFYDNEKFVWGDWIYTGWTNTAQIEGLGKLEVNDSSSSRVFFSSAYVNNDGKIDVKDLYACGKSFGYSLGQLEYSSSFDVNADGRIDLKDYWIIAVHFGETRG